MLALCSPHRFIVQDIKITDTFKSIERHHYMPVRSPCMRKERQNNIVRIGPGSGTVQNNSSTVTTRLANRNSAWAGTWMASMRGRYLGRSLCSGALALRIDGCLDALRPASPRLSSVYACTTPLTAGNCSASTRQTRPYHRLLPVIAVLLSFSFSSLSHPLFLLE